MRRRRSVIRSIAAAAWSAVTGGGVVTVRFSLTGRPPRHPPDFVGGPARVSRGASAAKNCWSEDQYGGPADSEGQEVCLVDRGISDERRCLGRRRAEVPGRRPSSSSWQPGCQDGASAVGVRGLQALCGLPPARSCGRPSRARARVALCASMLGEVGNFLPTMSGRAGQPRSIRPV